MSGYRFVQGGRIDRARPVTFHFDGRALQGFAGDTLASALLANGVRLVGRSFKYHRPRGIVTAGPEESCALVERGEGARREPNVPATVAELYDGFVAASQNRWPSLGFDIGAVNDLLAPLLPAGFYYKTFMWPPKFWERLYEPLIRRAAGLGRGAGAADPDHYVHMHHHCDVLVVGLGAAGLSAAVAAAESGARVIAVEQDVEPGGALLADAPQADWLAGACRRLGHPSIKVLTRTTAIGAYDHNVVAAVERVTDHLPPDTVSGPRQMLHVVRAGRTIFATGTIDRLIAFPGNDRPGVMLADAARVYAARYGVSVGRNVAFFVNNDHAYEAAFALADSGVEIAAIVDVRSESAGMSAAVSRGLRVLAGHEIVQTHGGRGGVHAISVRSLDGSHGMDIPVDVLCISGGAVAQAQLASQARLPLQWHDAMACFTPGGSTGRLDCAGAMRGQVGLRAAIADGARAGRGRGIEPPGGDDPRPSPLKPHWEVAGGSKAFVDLQHDVTADDIRLAHREGYSHVEHAKRYTTHGMGTDQGRIGGLVGSAVLASTRGLATEAVGLPKFRPFATPVTWGALAGSDVGMEFKPRRRLPLHEWHARNGAVFVNIGLWLRPLVYSPSGDTSWGPVLAEARQVRNSVGLTDVSSLGKIDVQGPDAAVFLDRIYANTFSTLPVGRARYGLMLREDGILFDDGTTSRLAPDRFVVTTTTQKAADALETMEWHLQTVWPELDVTLTNVADHWAQFALAGPKSRETLVPLVGSADFSNAAFPFMAAAEAQVAGIAGRLFRISFSGEMAYEIAVPAHSAKVVWDALLESGKRFGIVPYGLDALNLMRIEKGHVTGAEINGTTTPRDLGLGRMLKKNGDFVGRVLGEREGLLAAGRLQLVGLAPVDPARRLRNGAHLVRDAGAAESQGYVTSSCMSSVRDGWVGLALLADGHARHGERMVANAAVFGDATEVRIESPHMYDPENHRVRA